MSENHEKAKYYRKTNEDFDHKWHHFYDAIERAEKDFKHMDSYESTNTSCDIFLDFLNQDIKHWIQSGITKSSIDNTIRQKRGVHYQVINHTLYRDMDCMFPSRCQGIEYFIKKAINQLPNMDLIINVRDYPQVHNNWDDLPVLSFSKDTTQYNDILYPAWTFWAGGPAIDRYPTGIGRWDLMRQSITKRNDEWKHKSSKAFFRGSRTSSSRDTLIFLSRDKPDLIDAQYTANQAWKSVADTLGQQPVPTISFEDQCKYKYLINMRGVAASFRYKHLFLCKSLVLNVNSNWIEFFYPQLKPWIHFVPVAEDMNDLEEKIMFLKSNDKIAQKIAEKGFDFIWKHLTLESVQCYWDILLDNYSKLLKYKPNLNKNLIIIA
ncbi:O-glucosyltransferase rumi homolog [Oppia nitens]|uniref:O-glucosyltransferase rumi homolog n=1 Tax=Oppia nitens TaxID=1686743 RepID=UPI0023D9D39A|nr:O-glucosyltransferase rumi homolog [Oppia nitens]